MSKLELTKRDLLVFEKLGSYGLMSTKQLVRLMFPGIDESIALRRIRRLRSKGYLTTHSGLERGRQVWALTKKALDRIGSDLSVIAVNRHTLEHDILVSEVRLRLEKGGRGDQWKNGFSLKREAGRSEEAADTQIPDSVFSIPTLSKPMTFALELETVRKSNRRYRHILGNYAFKSEIHVIWYVVRSRALGEFLIQESFRLEGEIYPKLYYSVLEEVIDETKPVILIGPEKRIEWIKAGDQAPDQGQVSPKIETAKPATAGS